MTVIFSDTLFSIKRISRGFKARYFELSMALTDETTFTSAGSLFDWLYDNPVFPIPNDKQPDIQLWLSIMDWIESHTTGTHRNMMLRNHWQNFFLGLETELKHRLNERNIKAISSGHKLFDGFCKLLCENCRKHHDVQFYADKLCITPYYLSRITDRIFSVSPKELIDRQIVMEIKSLLTTTELSIKEIAERFHFEDTLKCQRVKILHFDTPTCLHHHFTGSSRRLPSEASSGVNVPPRYWTHSIRRG